MISYVGVLFIPLFAEFFLCKFGVIKVHSAVDFLQISADGFTVFVRNELAAVAYLMDYTELIFRLGKNRVYRITKPCEVIVTGDENVLHTAFLRSAQILA